MTCTHERQTSEYVREVNDFDGTDRGRWVYNIVSTTRDIDLHRYRCTQCDTVMYYSGRAREYYERGVRCDVPGLGG